MHRSQIDKTSILLAIYSLQLVFSLISRNLRPGRCALLAILAFDADVRLKTDWEVNQRSRSVKITDVSPPPRTFHHVPGRFSH